jgi:hypothetical protein
MYKNKVQRNLPTTSHLLSYFKPNIWTGQFHFRSVHVRTAACQATGKWQASIFIHYRAQICKRLRSQESIPRTWRARTINSIIIPARQGGGIDSLGSNPRFHRRLQIRVLQSNGFNRKCFLST